MEHVWGRGEVYTGLWWGNLSEWYYLEDPGVDGPSGRGMGDHVLDSSGSGYGQEAGTCIHSNAHSGCIKFGEFLD